MRGTWAYVGCRVRLGRYKAVDRRTSHEEIRSRRQEFLTAMSGG
jgi:hypothetical protein